MDSRTDASVDGAIAERTPGKYRARIARTGTMVYPTGTEYRDAATLFDPLALASLAGVPVRLGHGGRDVGRVVDGPVWRERGSDGHDYLDVVIEITDAATRAAIASGDLREFSPGYTAAVVPEAGVDPVTRRPYTHRQRSVRDFYELAILPPHGARCGDTCTVLGRADHQPPIPKEPSPMPCSCTPHTDALERRIDAAAGEAKIDAAELRRALGAFHDPSEAQIASAAFSLAMAARARGEQHADGAEERTDEGALTSAGFSRLLARRAAGEAA